jgi:hypothetical protein
MNNQDIENRLDQANQILKLIRPDAFLQWNKGIYFCWTDYKGVDNRKRWVPSYRGSDYPSVRNLPFGGTCTRATMELTRWVRGMPVRPISMWNRFVNTGGVQAVLETAERIGWPKQVPCVMCGRLVGDNVNWDYYDHKPYQPGPGCWYGEGCKADQ